MSPDVSLDPRRTGNVKKLPPWESPEWQFWRKRETFDCVLLSRRLNLQILRFRLPFAERDRTGLGLDPIEELGVGALARLEVIQCDRVVVALRQPADLEAAVLIGPARLRE